MAISFVICAGPNKTKGFTIMTLFYHGALQNLLVICISVQLDKNITISLYILQRHPGAQAIPVSHTDDPGSLPGQSMWDLWRTLALGQAFLRVLRFCHVSVIPPSPVRIHSSLPLCNLSKLTASLTSKKNIYDNKLHFSFLSALNCYQNAGQHLNN